MRARVKGQSTEFPHLFKGVPFHEPWHDFATFRAWALSTGFCKERPSPDRQDSIKGYVPGNIVWKSVRDNMIAANAKSREGREANQQLPSPFEDLPF
jgi:hypothetical protein